MKAREGGVAKGSRLRFGSRARTQVQSPPTVNQSMSLGAMNGAPMAPMQAMAPMEGMAAMPRMSGMVQARAAPPGAAFATSQKRMERRPAPASFASAPTSAAPHSLSVPKPSARSQRPKGMMRISARAMPPQEVGPRTLAKWIVQSRAGVYEPAEDGRSATTLVGCWNFTERLRELLNCIRDLEPQSASSASSAPSKPTGDAMDLVDGISSQSAELNAMKASARLGTRTIAAAGSADEREALTLASHLQLLRAVLLSFVMCSAMKRKAMTQEGLLQWDDHRLRLNTEALHAASDADILGVARGLLEMLEKET